MILYRDLIEIFPNCKVILTVASDSSVWYELVKSSFHSPEELTKVQQNDGKHKYLNMNKKRNLIGIIRHDNENMNFV